MNKITTAELARALKATLHGDESLELKDVAKIEEAGPDDVTFVANPAYMKHLATTHAGAVILKEVPNEPHKFTCIVSDDPYRAFLSALQLFHPPADLPAPGIDPTAVVADSASVDDSAYIGPHCVVEDDAVIGPGTRLRAHVTIGFKAVVGAECLFHNRVVVRERCRIGDRVIVQDGAVIGSDGFGFAPGEEAYMKIPQVGIVVLEDDVEIGANTTIDRATLGETRVCKGAKIDNLVQIAHNVIVGENTVIAAQTGIAGSSKLGKWVMLGGQVGISGHIRLGDGVKVAAQSGIPSDVKDNVILGGYPAVPIRKWHRISAAMNRLPDLLKRVKRLEDKQG
ncbi:UDP-3-O-(3-hydroxymyristoyl)glucosamine N-acyltransferase [bacterium]|nr:UDP-3-O-(3-hydroxymyristoyl)glucosamine N-acyltransferase [bacterium]